MSKKDGRVISPLRIVELREEKKWTQTRLAKEMSEVTPKNTDVKASLVSMWEAHKRNIPLTYLETFSKVFGVSDAYLCEWTDDPNVTFDQILEERKDKRPQFEIGYWQLISFDQQPIYVVFNNYEYENGWAIYNKNKHTFIFAEKTLKEDDLIVMKVRFFTRDISRDTGEFSNSRRLDRESIMKMERMYVQMISPDPYIRGLYDGWFRHNENRTALINDRGLILPYDGLGISFQAFYGEPQV